MTQCFGILEQKERSKPAWHSREIKVKLRLSIETQYEPTFDDKKWLAVCSRYGIHKRSTTENGAITLVTDAIKKQYG